ncbi:replication factor-A carboxy-terminal domain protein [Spatholobus suberectus]|nr:replication factor-A carboxy-terminal domain protein [Spatholobus suberectus]
MVDKVKDIYLGKQAWSLLIRVIHIWNMTPVHDQSNPFTVEMVLIDDEGSKIQAPIRKPMLRKFNGCVKERVIYKMSYFGVVPNSGSCRATKHEFKLLFHAKTFVIPFDDA